MEHAVDEPTINRMVTFIEYIFACPRTGQDWMDAFIEYCKSDNRDRNKCEKCVSDCKKRFDNSIP